MIEKITIKLLKILMAFFFKNISLLFIIFIICSCQFNSQTVEYKRAEKLFEEQKLKEALNHYQRVVKSKPSSPIALEAARRGARIAHLETNNYLQAAELYRHIIIYSKSDQERIDAQKKLASVYFEKLSDYPNAIKEYSRLLPLTQIEEETLDYRFIIAKSYFYLNNFYQAAVEMKEILARNHNEESRFEYLAFKGNILLTTKKLDEAIVTFKELMQRYPEQAMKENVPISLAVTYEEKGEYNEAIQILEKIKKNHPAPEFLELRIKRLRERVLNQPGAHGLIK